MSGGDAFLHWYSFDVMIVVVGRWILLMVTSNESSSEEAVAAVGKEESFAVSPGSSALLACDRGPRTASHGSMLSHMS